MHLYLRQKLLSLKVDELTFFRMSHVWSFGTDPDLHNEVAQFLLHGIIPPYVVRYIRHLQEVS